MRFILGKKGAGHFEMITGFIFFIGSIFFMFMFLSPWDNLSLPNSALNELYDSFWEEVNTNLSSVFISADIEGLKGSCFMIDLPEDIFKYAITDDGSRVTVLGGDKISSKVDSGILQVHRQNNFFRVALSPVFDDDESRSCAPLDNFELGGVVELEVVSYPELEVMNESYYSDYPGLKSRLKVVDIFDFAIVFEGMDEFRMEPEHGVPDGVDVLAKDYVVKVLKSNGAVSNERISFRIW